MITCFNILYLQLIFIRLTAVLQVLVSKNWFLGTKHTRLVFKPLQINARSKSYQQQQNSIIRRQCGNHFKREKFQYKTNKVTASHSSSIFFSQKKKLRTPIKSPRLSFNFFCDDSGSKPEWDFKRIKPLIFLRTVSHPPNA